MAKFKKGQSGNPSGRKRGTSHAAKLRKAIDEDLPEIITAMVCAAKGGDTAAAKLLFDRALPAVKPVQQAIRIEGLEGKSLSEQGELVVVAASKGLITAEQSQAMLSSLASLFRIKELDDIEQRLRLLEENENTTE